MCAYAPPLAAYPVVLSYAGAPNGAFAECTCANWESLSAKCRAWLRAHPTEVASATTQGGTTKAGAPKWGGVVFFAEGSVIACHHLLFDNAGTADTDADTDANAGAGTAGAGTGAGYDTDTRTPRMRCSQPA